MQQKHSPNNSSSSSKKAASLSITKTGKATLSKNQQEFNKLTARIEKLRKDIDRKQSQFETALNLFSTNIYPLRQQTAQHRRQLLTHLWPFYKKQQLSKADQSYLKGLLKNLLQDVLDATTTEPDEELKKMFKELEGQRYETVQKREEAEMKKQMKDMFEDAGMDIDLKDIDLDSDDIDKKMAEAQHNMQEKWEKEREEYRQRRAARQKTPKQLEKEKLQQQVDELKQKNISTIYRQLAKLFHPDLEQNEDRRAEKEVLMKELTSAYDAKNLHALLSLELKWIHNESNHLETLTEEKLAVYLHILREQAKELEIEKNQLINKPQYHILIEAFGYREMTYPLKTITDEQKSLETAIHEMQLDIEKLQQPNAIKHVKQIVKEFKEAEKNQPDDLISWMMQQMMKEARF